MRPNVFIVTGPTGSGKTLLSTSILRTTHGYLLPVDQLQMYQHLGCGVGLERELLTGVVIRGYNEFDPWVRLTPYGYVTWLSDTVHRIPAATVTIVEGGSTTYVKELLKQTEVSGFHPPFQMCCVFPTGTEAERMGMLLRHYSRDRVLRIRAELETLISLRLLSTEGHPILASCEQVMVQPDYKSPHCAWALRAAACVYYPALRFLLGEDTLDASRERIASNILRVQNYQISAFSAMMPRGILCTIEEAERRIKGYFSAQHLFSADRQSPAAEKHVGTNDEHTT